MDTNSLNTLYQVTLGDYIVPKKIIVIREIIGSGKIDPFMLITNNVKTSRGK